MLKVTTNEDTVIAKEILTDAFRDDPGFLVFIF